jgi:hypothetical protein
MNTTQKLPAAIHLVLAFAMIALAIMIAFKVNAPSLVKAASDIISFQTIPTSTGVYVGTADTLLIATNTARTYLEISNVSGATTTAQTLYCAPNGAAATAYSGFTLFASTTKVFSVDNDYQGALHCIAPVGSTARVTVIEK